MYSGSGAAITGAAQISSSLPEKYKREISRPTCMPKKGLQ